MEGVIVCGMTTTQPRWQSGLVGCALVVAKPAVVRLSVQQQQRRRRGVRCCSEGQDSDEDYVQAHVVEAVRMVPSQGQLLMTLSDGREVEVNHVNPAKGHLLYKGSTPTIFLKMSDDSGLMLPIVVGWAWLQWRIFQPAIKKEDGFVTEPAGQAAVAMLMKGLHEGAKMGRPNQYQILKDIVDSLNYEARMVRVTERVLDTYYARIFIGKAGDEELVSVDARPSDAINLAVRCKIPIYVNKSIVATDAVRPVYKPLYQREGAFGRSIKSDSFLDSADVVPDTMAEEITLMRNMLVAVVEERYTDAARWRDELTKLRAMAEWQLRQGL